MTEPARCGMIGSEPIPGRSAIRRGNASQSRRAVRVMLSSLLWLAVVPAPCVAASSAPSTIAHPLPAPRPEPYIVVRGPDGNIWFTESGANRIGRLDVRTGVITEFGVPTPDSRPIGLTVGGDGHLWFTENSAGKVGRLSVDGAFAEFACPTPNAGPDGMHTDERGEVWFAERLADRLAHVSAKGVITEYGSGISPGAHPLAPTSRKDEIWFSEPDGNRLAFLRNGTITELPLRPGTQPRAMMKHPDGSLWFVATSARALVRVDAANQIQEFPVPDSRASLRALATGPDGRIWFTEDVVNRIGVMSATGQLLAEYPLPASLDGLRGIAVLEDGRVFFAANGSGAIGELRFDGR